MTGARHPIPPPEWDLPDPAQAPPGQDLVLVGGGLDPGTLISGLLPRVVPDGGGHRGGSWRWIHVGLVVP